MSSGEEATCLAFISFGNHWIKRGSDALVKFHHYFEMVVWEISLDRNLTLLKTREVFSTSSDTGTGWRSGVFISRTKTRSQARISREAKDSGR
jgi:hypothetical protein